MRKKICYLPEWKPGTDLDEHYNRICAIFKVKVPKEVPETDCHPDNLGVAKRTRGLK